MRRKILITGATSGIGLVLAARLAGRHDVMITGRKKPKDISEALRTNFTYVQASQTEPEAATQAIAKALLKSGWTSLDNAILNAGTGIAATHAIDEVDAIRATMDVNLTSSILLSRALYPWLEKARGRLTLIGSVAHKGQAQFPAYAASKGALNGFARSLGSEWAGNVRVQMLHPGPTRTDMHEKAGFDPGWMRELFLSPEGMAKMIETAVASRPSTAKLSWARYYGGGSLAGRRL